MAENDGPVKPESTSEPSNEVEGGPGESERLRPLVTRRDFLVGTGAGAVVVGVVAGGAFAASEASRRTTTVSPPAVVQPAPGAPAVAVPPAVPGAPVAPAPQPAPAPATAPAQTLPLTMRRVTLNMDGATHETVVDVRESLWETMTNKLGMASSNLGCDRAMCGACAVVVDGKAVNGCTVLTARLGRGQKILTVNGLTTGPGPDGLHPIQRAFWWEGGYQCGICTRGFIMSTYALLETNKNPNDDQIAEALAGNICRCGEYPKIYSSVKAAAAEMRGEKVTWTAPLTVVAAPRPAGAPAPAAAPARPSKQFQFATALPTIEFFDPLAEQLKERKGIVEVAGSERTITITWEPPLTEADVRRIMAELGNPVQP